MSSESLPSLFKNHGGKVSDKWRSYLTEYDRLLSGFRRDKINFLEIGVQNGGSLEIWSRYFSKAEVILGCDIDPACAELAFDDKRIKVIVGDATSKDTRDRILEISSSFNVIIDDGSHTSSNIIKSFVAYFPLVADGGIYIVEDLHCSYWEEFEGGLFDPLSSISFLKTLADAVNYDYWGVCRPQTDVFRGFLSEPELELLEPSLDHIHSIEFINSMCIVRKSKITNNQLGNRVIVGSTEQVTHLDFPSNQKIEVPTQENNVWSTREIPPGEELQIRLREADRHEERIVGLDQQVEQQDAQISDLNLQMEQRDSQLSDLNRQLERRDSQLSDLNLQLEQRDSQLSDLNLQLEQRDSQLSDLNRQLDQRDGQLSDLNLQLEQRDGQLSDLNRQLEQRDSQLSDLNRQLERRDSQLSDLNRQLEQRDSQLSDLNRQLEQRDSQLSDLNQQLEQRDGQLNDLNQQLEQRDGQLNDLNQQLEQRDVRMLTMSEELRAQSAMLDYVFNSLSWRLGYPLRAIARLGHFNKKFYLDQNPDVKSNGVDPYEHYIAYGRREGRAPRPPRLLSFYSLIFNSLKKAVKDKGGFGQSLSGLVSIYKDEGFSGVKTRIGSLVVSREQNNYAEWIRKYDSLSEENRARIRAQIAGLKDLPLISIVMPTYNTKITWLKDAIDSVRAQIYENWELCIADDASTDVKLKKFLRSVSNEDDRIKVLFCEENGHISKASNVALGICTGEWVALLDHDDLLAEHALFCVADMINSAPDAQLIYSDEDKINENGQRTDPYFKCDWNLDLFYSQNMITHLGVYKRHILNNIGGFREGFEGAQDYDLALRYIEQIDQKDIHHIPRVLYHWRIHPDSTAHGLTAKPYAMIAGEKALQEHFDRNHLAARIERLSFGYRVHYDLPTPRPLVTLIIPTHNAKHLLKTCIESIIEKTTYKNYEILIVDNRSDDPETLDYFSSLQDRKNIRIIRDDLPFNFSRLNNSAVNEAQGELIAFINNDIEVISSEWLTEMVSMALQDGVGAVGAKLLFPDDTVQHAGVVLGIGGVAGHAFKYKPESSWGYFGRAKLISSYSAVTAACLVIRKETFLQAGGFDDKNVMVAFNDVDFCLRILELGYRNVWTPYALLYHHESATRGDDDTAEKKARFDSEVQYMQKRWGQKLLKDPAYSPNLSMVHEDFRVAWPPRLNMPGGESEIISKNKS